MDCTSRTLSFTVRVEFGQMTIKSTKSLSKVIFQKNRNTMSLLTASDPLVLFNEWYTDHRKQEMDSESSKRESMTLATSSPDGYPTCRTVLLHGFSGNSFRFFSYSHSNKGSQMDANPRVALCFNWETRQVRVEGLVNKCSSSQNDEYFYSRSYQSQINAHAKRQSSEIKDLSEYSKILDSLKLKYPEGKKVVPRPDYWCGYEVKPLKMDFWKVREDGDILDQRFEFSRTSIDSQEWVKKRLFP